MSDYRELLLGCGSQREKAINRFLMERNVPMGAAFIDADHIADARIRSYTPWRDLVTLDSNPDHGPDIIYNLESAGMRHSHGGGIPYFDDQARYNLVCAVSTYDELHAYEVLEHIGQQGDATAFFQQFTEFHRILKPGGLFCATCPSWSSPWAWGDPSHTRVITSGTLAFLSQRQYREQVGVTPMSDFRNIYKADFEPVFVHEDQHTLAFVLRAIK